MRESFGPIKDYSASGSPTKAKKQQFGKNYSKGLKTFLGSNKPINMSRHEQVKSIINDWYSNSKESSLRKKAKMFHEGNGLPLDSGKMASAEGMRSVPMLTNKNSLTIQDPPTK